MTGNVGQFRAYLVEQAAQGGVERMADMEILAVPLLQVGRAEAHRKKRTAQPFDDVAQCLARGKLAASGFQWALLRQTPALTRGTQVTHDFVETPECRDRWIVGGTKRCVHCSILPQPSVLNPR